MFLPPVAIRGLVCMASAYAELPWDGICKGLGLFWNRCRCAAYVITIPVANLQPILPKKVWFYWYLFAPSARGLTLVAAQLELGCAPSWKLCLLVAVTLFAVDPPWGEPIQIIHRLFAVLYAVGVLAGLQDARPTRAGYRDETLRRMLTVMAFLEVVYYTGGWAWGIWWIFPVAQAVTKLVCWGWHERTMAQDPIDSD